MKTDTTEKGLESLIMRHMTGTDGLGTGAAGMAEAAPAEGIIAETPDSPATSTPACSKNTYHA